MMQNLAALTEWLKNIIVWSFLEGKYIASAADQFGRRISYTLGLNCLFWN